MFERVFIKLFSILNILAIFLYLSSTSKTIIKYNSKKKRKKVLQRGFVHLNLMYATNL